MIGLNKYKYLIMSYSWLYIHCLLSCSFLLFPNYFVSSLILHFILDCFVQPLESYHFTDIYLDMRSEY